MPSLRDEISNTIERLRGRAAKKRQAEETVLATDPREGRHYGNYRILRRLGVGGMGHVYLAIDTHLGRHAALKFLSPKLKSNPEMLARLHQEARTASSLNHPNILTIYDISEADGEPFIASEFVDGVTLRQALERGAIDPRAALDIAIQIASALKPAHEAGITHRDLKPGNVMLRPDGLVKVIDFGLAKFTAQGLTAPMYEPVSAPGSIAGTVQYMSPEQARGDAVDHRTDLWSLGVMLYEMVARTKPFDGVTESHIIVAILDHTPQELKPVPGVPAGLARVVEKALSKSADKRYQTAQEMLLALKTIAEADGITRTSRLFTSAMSARPRPRSMLAAFIAGAALLALSLCWILLGGREWLLGPDWFVPSHFRQVTHTGNVALVAISPAGDQIAYVTEAAGENRLHLMHLDTRAEWTWPPYSGTTLGVTFSPDNAIVYYTVHDQREWGRLYSVKDRSAEVVTVLDDVDGPIAFSPDGSRFAFHRRADDKRTNRESIIVANTADTGDQKTLLTKFDTVVGTRVAWSSGGRIAVNLGKQTLGSEAQPAVFTFSQDGKQLGEFTDPRLRRLSGPAWIDPRSLMVFSGFGRESDDWGSGIIELSVHQKQFRFFDSPTLVSSSVTVSRDFKKIASISSTRRSTLWVADAKALNRPQQWSAGDSFDSLTWSSDDTVVHPSPRGGNITLYEVTATHPGQLLLNNNNKDCISHEPAAVPGKAAIVFASNCGAAANSSNLWLLDRTTGNLSQLTAHSTSDEQPAVAADGDTVLYNSWEMNFPYLMKLSLRMKTKSQFSSLQARNGSISPDSKRVACQIRESYDGSWRQAILSMRDGVIQKDNLPLPADANSVVRWSPDGSALDYVNARDPANIWRFPLNGSAPQPLTQLKGDPITDFHWNSDGSKLAWVSCDVKRDVVIFLRGASQ